MLVSNEQYKDLLSRIRSDPDIIEYIDCSVYSILTYENTYVDIRYIKKKNTSNESMYNVGIVDGYEDHVETFTSLYRLIEHLKTDRKSIIFHRSRRFLTLCGTKQMLITMTSNCI
jgi:hypothetical protein